MNNDWFRLYDLEGYLFGTVHERFRVVGELGAFDFFCIVIWKANRAKSKIAKRLLADGHADLEAVAIELTRIAAQPSPRERLRVTLQAGLRLPLATALLTVLYPDEFTVYDVRACGVLGRHGKVGAWTSFDQIWDGYLAYKRDVEAAAPQHLSLRDKDRWLWSQSFGMQLRQDIGQNFAKPVVGQLAAVLDRDLVEHRD